MFDPRSMQKMMKQMGIKSEEIEAERVIIECKEENIVISKPSVIQISAQGQEFFQVSGQVKKEGKLNEEDIRLVMEKAGVEREKAIEALSKSGSIAEAIILLKQS